MLASLWLVLSGCNSSIDTGGCAEECPTGLACHDGECVDPGDGCEGVVCPSGQTCLLGSCVEDDLCEDVTCTNPGEVCIRGACVVDDDGDGVPSGDDCDDSDPAVYPGADEQCNGIDDDCDGELPIDELDEDGDGSMVCDGDCDAGCDTCNPDAPEICDALDNDCDDRVDEPTEGEPICNDYGSCQGAAGCVWSFDARGRDVWSADFRIERGDELLCADAPSSAPAEFLKAPDDGMRLRAGSYIANYSLKRIGPTCGGSNEIGFRLQMYAFGGEGGFESREVGVDDLPGDESLDVVPLRFTITRDRAEKRVQARLLRGGCRDVLFCVRRIEIVEAP